jgi:hypothetical protein
MTNLRCARVPHPVMRCVHCAVLQVVSPVDARIHFALNCGAASCPTIKLYSTDTLEEGLTGAAEAFCTSEVVVDAAAQKVRLGVRKVHAGTSLPFGRQH